MKKKSQSEIEIEALDDIFSIATTGFEKFYKDTSNSSSGNYSKAASSGNSSTAASSGDSSTAASSGDSSTAASSGDCSKAASSGNYSKAASSGDCSTAASSGDYSTAASSGDSSTAASSGDSSTAASSGDYSTAASSGDYSKAASSGDSSKAASSGNSSKAASSGEHSACSALGYMAAVKGDIGNLVMASEYVEKNGNYIPIGGKADIIDGKKLKAGSWYIVEKGEWVEVDFTDNIFSYIISHKGNVKKVRNKAGEIAFIVSDEDGNNSHGKTIKEASHELAFKTANRNIEQFRNMPIGTKKSPTDWAFVYRAITGACRYGTENFIKEQGKLKTKYSLEEILEITKGQYGHDKFKEAVA